MKAIKNEENPCYKCPERTERCRFSCKRHKIYSIKKELEHRRIEKYNLEHGYPFTDACDKRVIKNLWKNGHYRNDKGE